MKKNIIAAVLALALFASCQKGAEGPAGPDAPAGGIVMHFANGSYPSTTYFGCLDTQVNSFDNTANFSADQSSYAGTQTGDRKRILLKFNLSLLPANATVVSAGITMRVSGVFGTSPALSFRRITSEWTAAEATWNAKETADPWTNAGGDFTSASCSNSVTVTAAGTYIWELDKACVQAWAGSPSTNFGVILVSNNESVSDSQANFSMSENATVAARPKLSVVYTLP